MEDLITALVGLAFSGFLVYAICIAPYKTTIIKEKCTCGQEEKWCASYLYTGGNTLLGRKNRFSCKKNRDAFNELVESPAIKRIRKEIKENGSSCPENW